MSNESVNQLNEALSLVDAQATRIGAAVTGIGTRINNLLNEITALPTSADVQALVDRAKGEAAVLVPLADSLTGLAADPANPVPTPVPDPGPAPVPTPDPTPVIQ